MRLATKNEKRKKKQINVADICKCSFIGEYKICIRNVNVNEHQANIISESLIKIYS